MTNLHRGYCNRRVLITGANGFIGTHLTQALRQAGAKVFTLDSRGEGQPANAYDFRCSVTDASSLARIAGVAEPEAVFHLAAVTDRSATLDKIDEMIQVNLVGTANLIRVLRPVRSVQAIIVAGTAEEYGINRAPFGEELRENPVTPYSFSKVCASYLCRLSRNLFDLPVLVLRATLAYGPGQRGDMFIPSLIRSLRANQAFKMSSGDQTRDCIYIDDLVSAYLQAGLARPEHCDVLNIGLGRAYRLKEIAALIGELMGKSHLITPGARPYRPCEVMQYRISIGRAKRLLGWAPKIGLREGLRRTIAAAAADA